MAVALGDRSRVRPALTLFLVSLAGLLLEVGYTRIVSFKLWYYYTYLVIGLALLGIGSGGIFLVVFKRLHRAATERIVVGCSVLGAASIAVGYLVVARVPIDTIRIWEYGTFGSAKNLALLGVICFVLFASFVAIGMIVATILGRARDEIGRLYFADLMGAGLGCLAAIPLISRFGPPALVMLSALLLAVPALYVLRVRRSMAFAAAALVAVVLAGVVADYGRLPDVRPERTKIDAGPVAEYSAWGPVFRVDVLVFPGGNYVLIHDGNVGAAMHPYDDDPSTLTRYASDTRALPFRTLGAPPRQELIIGSAGGNEILASLYFKAHKIDGVELNPVTVSLLTKHFKQLTGDLPHQPGVDIHNADGRSFLARSDDKYDLVWFVAPDSYAANNAASSGAFVLSESYLYTTRMITDTMKHLTGNGIMVVQFGELDYDNAPNRTARYVVTARRALRQLGITDAPRHILVSAFLRKNGGDLSTIMVKRTRFTPPEVRRFVAANRELPGTQLAYAPGATPGPGIVPQIAMSTSAEPWPKSVPYARDISPVTDDAPFFWHFVPFGNVLRDFPHSIREHDPENAIGERVLLLLLLVATAYAAVFLLLPFVAVRREWRALPAKGISAVYFASLGLGFMFFEITMIQRLTRFLGYPTYSLTVTLASILVATGLGALASKPLAARVGSPMPYVLGALALLTVLYQFGFDHIEEWMLSSPLGVRVVVAWLLLAPLGFCLGMFMPLGLTQVGLLTVHGDEYVAWAWAVNGFFSVIGSVLTTILSMEYGFRAVQFAALGIYAVAVLAFTRLRAIATRDAVEPRVAGPLALETT